MQARVGFRTEKLKSPPIAMLGFTLGEQAGVETDDHAAVRVVRRSRRNNRSPRLMASA